MANIYRVVATWQGWSGAPGYTSMYYDDSTGTAQQAADVTRAFLFACAGTAQNILPAGVSIQFQSSVDTLEPGTGSLVNSTAVTKPADVLGTGSGNFSSASGACISWLTSAIVGGHRVRGRTFLVPLASGGYDNQGTLATAYLASLQTAITTLLAATPDLVVWRRPISQAAGGGGTNLVLVGKVTDKAAVLTTRRD